jgi:shikimate dehydrogenase
MIKPGTKLCGVIGDPVLHTLSPAMHNAAIAELGIDYAYLAFHVKTPGLGAAVEGIRALGIRGLNVTIPHKVAVAQFLDELDPLARDIGAVNTIVNDEGKLKGYNTDAAGFLQSLQATGFELKGKKVVLLGAGGAARAMGFALAQAGSEITILNRKRTLSQAMVLSANLERISSSEVTALELNTVNLKAVLAEADLLVNATSAGMEPDAEETPVPTDLLKPGMTVFDVVYAPLETRLLREAASKGCQVVSGLEMLVRQAALAFKLWTGEDAPLEVMREAAMSSLVPNVPERNTKMPGPRKQRKTNIALVGFMGAGKSSVGKALARKTGKPFTDLDSLVEKRAGKSISRIFKEDGEPAFRQLEKAITADSARKSGKVIACGGGVLLDPSNITALKKSSIIVYLKASNSAILKRVSSGPLRPLLADGKDIVPLITSRKPLYEQSADITIDTTRLGVDRAADRIIERLGEYESFRF